MVAKLTRCCFVGFGTDSVRREEAMKTADRENPNPGVGWFRDRAHGAAGQNKSRSIQWALSESSLSMLSVLVPTIGLGLFFFLVLYFCVRKFKQDENPRWDSRVEMMRKCPFGR